MTAAATKIIRIMNVLNHLYPAPPIPLNHFDNFSLLCAVVLSAQTTDGKVNEVTKVLFERAPTPHLMAQLSIPEVQEIIQPVGLAPAKAKYLVGLSNDIVTKFGGQVPNTWEVRRGTPRGLLLAGHVCNPTHPPTHPLLPLPRQTLESLPGVGHKTASVMMSQAFGEEALAVDTHVHRLAGRWGLSSHANVDRVQQDLQQAFPREQWNKLHLQMIYFGRGVSAQ